MNRWQTDTLEVGESTLDLGETTGYRKSNYGSLDSLDVSICMDKIFGYPTKCIIITLSVLLSLLKAPWSP